MPNVEDEYRSRLDALPGRERVSRAVAQLKWVREMIAREILAESPDLSEERLKWEVALRLYGGDPATRRLIERKLADVPG